MHSTKEQKERETKSSQRSCESGYTFNLLVFVMIVIFFACTYLLAPSDYVSAF